MDTDPHDLPDETPRRRRWWPVIVPVVLVLLTVSLLSGAGRRQWALSLVQQPTRFTALFFNDPAALPSAAVAGQLLPVSFSIANNEGRTVGYRYVITESSAAGSSVLKTAAGTVGDGRTLAISTVIRPSCARSPCRIEISLPGHPEKIDFRLALFGLGPAAGG